MRQARALRELLAAETFLSAGGCYDALSGRVAEAVGFKIAYAGGFGIEATLAGAPDIGFLTLTEFANHLKYIASAMNVPLIADGEAGFGSIAGVTRLVREFEGAGVAGIHIEDQVNPKVCPALPLPRRVVSREEGAGRIRAACAARSDGDFVIIGRTDADVVSLDEMIARCRLYLEAGADLAMPLLTQVDGKPLGQLSREEQLRIHARVCQEVDGPLVWAEIPRGLTLDDIKGVGYKLCLVVAPPIIATFEALFSSWRAFLADGTADRYFTERPFPIDAPNGAVPSMLDFLDAKTWLETERMYAPAD
jgi:2-methylisocitrate lyase-like PEP mutase family enzyme